MSEKSSANRRVSSSRGCRRDARAVEAKGKTGERRRLSEGGSRRALLLGDRRRAGGQAEGEGGALAGAALGAEAALVALDDVAADGEAQAGPALSGGVRAGLRGEERLEDAPEVRGTY